MTGGKKLRILFVAMPESIHTVRWTRQLLDQGWDLHLFPVDDAWVHPMFREITVHGNLHARHPGADRSVRFYDDWWPWMPRNGRPFPRDFYRARRFAQRFLPLWRNRAARLARCIERVKPDIIHSLELQHSAYLTEDARKLVRGKWPTWIVTNWGSDIYLFGRLPEHAARIRELLAAADYYSCEAERDVELGRRFGFKGHVLPVMPNTGGFDLAMMRALRRPGPTSARRTIVLKGYQHWAGRALVGVRALRLAADALKNYQIVTYAAFPDVELSARLLGVETGLDVRTVPSTSHEEILKLHGQARISIGLSISDGISTSFLEALVMGSFPIQSNTSTANEWIRDGETGILVPPEDPEPIAAAIRRAVADDALVDRAAEANAATASARLDAGLLRTKAVEMYRSLKLR